jgi:hypothetical protein
LIQRVNAIQTSVVEKNKTSNVSVMVVTGRSRRLAAEDHHAELRTIVQEHTGRGNNAAGTEIGRTLGEVGTALMVSGVKAGLLVMQAALPSERE